MTATMTAIPLFDYRSQYAALRAEILEAVARVFDSGMLILGNEVEAFEKAFVGYLGGRGHGIGMGNGTDALAVALRALDIGVGDEVITVANTAIPTVSAIRMAGAVPVFSDVDASTCLMDLNHLEALITDRTRAVIPVHLFGNVVDMDTLLTTAKKHGLRVVEDCAQSTGARLHDRAAGTFGDVGCFSFYPTKNLGAFGDGGFCFAADEVVAEAVRKIRFYGCGKTYYAEHEGVNSRLDEVQAAILNVKLKHLKTHVENRRAVARLYDENLSPGVERTPPGPGVDHAYHLYVIKTDRRDEVMKRLKAAHIGAGVHYATPVHLMSGYGFLGYRSGDLPVTERLADRILTLPCFPELSHEAVLRVCDVVNDAVE